MQAPQRGATAERPAAIPGQETPARHTPPPPPPYTHLEAASPLLLLVQPGQLQTEQPAQAVLQACRQHRAQLIHIRSTLCAICCCCSSSAKGGSGGRGAQLGPECPQPPQLHLELCQAGLQVLEEAETGDRGQ